MTDTNLSCQYSEQEDMIIDSVLGATASFSCLCCLFALSLVFLFQKYRTSTQRVILYLTLAILAHSAVQVLHVAGPKGNKIFYYCIFAGFMEQYVLWMVLMAITCLTFDLFIKVMFRRITTRRTEWIYVLLIFISPLLHTWIPFINDAYGIDGAWCWIRQFNKDCTRFIFGLVLQIVLYWVPLYIIAISILVAYMVARVKTSTRLGVYLGKFDPKERKLREQLMKEVRQYQLYPLIFLVVNILPFASTIAEAVSNDRNGIFILGVFHALCFGLQGAMITLAFALDSDTRRHLNRKSIESAFLRLCMKQENAKKYTIHHSSSDSLRRAFLEKERIANGDTVNSNGKVVDTEI